MKKRGLPIVAEGTYERNTTAIKTALLALRKAAPEAVVMVGAYQPCAEFIKLARKIEFNPVFVNISFVGASALAQELGTEGAGVIVSQVVPFPWDASVKVVADYQAAIKAADPKAEPEFVSLEGYLVGRLAIAALERAGPEPTRAGLLKAIKESGALRHRRTDDDLRSERQRRARQGVHDGDPAGRFVQGGRPLHAHVGQLRGRSMRKTAFFNPVAALKSAGIRIKLQLAFGAVALMTVVASGVAICPSARPSTASNGSPSARCR